MLVNLGSMRKSYLSMWHVYTFLAKCLEVGRKTLLTMLYECVICMLIYMYIYIYAVRFFTFGYPKILK